MKKERQCPECGVGHVTRTARPGRIVRYKNIPNLEVPASIEIPTCDSCGEEFVNEDLAKVLDEALETVYRQKFRTMTLEAIEVLSASLPQSKLERMLDLSQGYLTKLKGSVRTPRPGLALHLAFLALDPTERFRELESLLTSGLMPTLRTRQPGPEGPSVQRQLKLTQGDQKPSENTIKAPMEAEELTTQAYKVTTKYRIIPYLFMQAQEPIVHAGLPPVPAPAEPPGSFAMGLAA